MEIINNIQDARTAFYVCIAFILADVLTGYLKAFKLKEANSSISRDGYIKKMGWIVALILSVLVKWLVDVDLLLTGTVTILVATEGISVYENLGEIGINLKFKDYFAKLNNSSDEGND